MLLVVMGHMFLGRKRLMIHWRTPAFLSYVVLYFPEHIKKTYMGKYAAEEVRSKTPVDCQPPALSWLVRSQETEWLPLHPTEYIQMTYKTATCKH